MQIDFSSVNDAESFVSCPEGVYVCRVVEVREGRTREGHPRWGMRLHVADGPYAEAKEFLAGYWIVDVESTDRAYAIAARVSAAPGKGGVPLNMPIEIREVMSAPPVEA